ncbi:pentatricopeptide repeat-containing protein DOT4, chloroplastic isoform X2 [Cryptomeria japonica]|nr:pentatricopeptide repeat-containing protein DOT4, chloroplastic isoform X2 [Cryptomeria japonica]
MKEDGIEPDVTTWNTMITSYAQSGQCHKALGFFCQMQQQADILPNVISWTAMIAGYSQNGLHDKALEFFYEMQQVGVRSDSVTISNVLSACAHVASLQKGKEIHGYIVRNSNEFHSSVCSALIAMYSACGNIAGARWVFDRTPETDKHLVLWNAMIAGYSQNGDNSQALELFRDMQIRCGRLDSVTIASVLPACAGLATLKQGKEIHAYAIRNGFVCVVLVQNALIDMYAKCGNIRYARLVFDNMSERDVVSWTVMIAGYGMHGLGEDSVSIFRQMQQAGMKPNLVTFTCLMSACSHTGLLDEGLEYFSSMTRDLQIKPSMEIYACTVDLLGRAGRLDEAQKIIESMPFQPNACLWGALLGACRMHSNIQVGEYAAKQLYKLEPENAANYVLMSNIYAAAGRWYDVAKVRKMMEEAGLKKPPGCSWIEVKNKLHTFVQGEESHPQMDEIDATLDRVAG